MTKQKMRFGNGKPNNVNAQNISRRPGVMDDTARATFRALDLAHRYTKGGEVAIPLKDGRVLAGQLRGATATHVLLNTHWIPVEDIKE